MRPAIDPQQQTSLEQMRADGVLPADIEPAAAAEHPPAGAVLLTGATGFVGAHLLHALLRDTTFEVMCLVRPDRRGLHGGDAARIRRNLESHGLWEPAWAGRVRPVAGDLRRPGLGCSQQQQELLAGRIDAIYHCAAAVNWVLPYSGLRAANVLGTRELLRLACRTRAKPFHFLSTIGVCYATGPDSQVLTETDDPWPLLDRLHLGYAQSKAVAEELVRQVRQRGLPAVVYRPALITGHSRTGAGNPTDFLTRGISACVRMGCAPDVSWCIDACPVDHVAEAVVRRATASPGTSGVLHLLHPDSRNWRELVLWMRLYGFPLRLVSYRSWLSRLARAAGASGHPLHPLLDFFRARVGGISLAETYVDGRRTRISADRTREALAGLGVSCPPLDARWLERFFGSLTDQGVLPPAPGRAVEQSRRAAPIEEGSGLPAASLAALLCGHFDDPRLCVRPAGPPQRLSQQSILTELTSWRCGSVAGLFRQRLELTSQRAGVPASVEVVIKVKTEDRHLLDVAAEAAALCDRRVGEEFARWRHHLGLAGGHLREIALYCQKDERWARFTPLVYAAAWDEARREGLVVLEHLSADVWMDPCTENGAWLPAQIEAAVRGLAGLQAIWFERRAELSVQPWLGPVSTAADVAERTDLWTALAAHAARYFVPWLGADVRRLQRRLLARIESWWRPLEQLPHTLVHNDFNPRNLALRQVGPEELRLCAYDWELATSAVPQHDLAQLLCFVLPFDCSRQTVRHYLDLHRHALELATDRRIDAADWQQGFGLALADLLINRLAMYTLVHAVRRQPFLERVLHTWRTLYAYFDPLC